MLTESQIEYCLAKIREQLTPVEGMDYKPNLDSLIGVIKQTIAEAYKDHNATYDTDSVFQIGLEERTASILDRNGYVTVLALRKATTKELLALRQVGPGMLDQVRVALAERGFALHGDLGKKEMRLTYNTNLRKAQKKRMMNTKSNLT